MPLVDRNFDALIVGAGHAGAQAAHALRAGRFGGTIGMVGREAHAPYERPPLSKEYLLGDRARERLFLRAPEFWAAQNIELLTGESVLELDARAHTVFTSRGRTLRYGRLIWATGGEPRRLALPAAILERTHVIRTLNDIDRLRPALASRPDVLIIGAGYIGLEAAAVLRKLACRVAVVEAAPNVLPRVAGSAVSAFLTAEHQRHGTQFHCGVTLTEASIGTDRRLHLGLSDGMRLLADIMIVGIGINPAIGPLAEAGALCDGGVVVDAYCRTSLPDVWAVGDCARHPNAFADGALIRLESVQNANDQAKVAVLDILGQRRPYAAAPWFWSDQFDLKLQTIGWNGGYDAFTVRGEPAGRSFSVIYFRHGAVCALDCINRPLDFAQGRLLLGRTVPPTDARLSDLAVPLRDIVSPAA